MIPPISSHEVIVACSVTGIYSEAGERRREANEIQDIGDGLAD